MIYKVWACLEVEYDDIEADSEEEAFQIASDAAMSGGSWEWKATPVEEEYTMEKFIYRQEGNPDDGSM